METLNKKFSEYVGYFDEIRKRVYNMAVVFIIFFIGGFFEAGHILKAIIAWFNIDSASIVTTSPFQFLDLAMRVGMYAGLIAVTPVFVYHTYQFLKNGLTIKERKLFFVLLPVGFLLFLSGFSYCVAILYFYLKSVAVINLAFGIKNVWDISTFLSQIILASTILGVVFQFPIVLTFLIKAGFVKAEYLRSKRFYFICGIFAFVGFLPPPDIFSSLFEALPLIILFEITIRMNSAKRVSTGQSGEAVQRLEVIETAI
jgi:sec-independent protein translocase protein TatC